MSDQDQRTSLEQQRREKAERWRAAGHHPFGNDPGPLESVGDIADRHNGGVSRDKALEHPESLLSTEYGSTVYRVAGRVIAHRDTGKLVFIKLRDGTGEIQLFCSAKEVGDGFAILKELDLGDVITAEGRPMRTKLGELSIQVRAFRPLTKAYNPIPSEWFGLGEVETRYRQRYADLIANHPDTGEVFRSRSAITRALREWFERHRFIEVETPTLQSVRGGATAKPFTTHHNALDLDLYLRIAPELYLKRLIVGGMDRVYEIGRVWRNEGLSTRHNPEFTILEFYQAYATYQVLMDETEDMIAHVDDRVLRGFVEKEGYPSYQGPARGTALPRFGEGRGFSLERPWVRVRMLDAITRSLTKRHSELAVTWGGGAALSDWPGFRDACLALPGLSKEERHHLGRCGTPGEGMFTLYETFAEPHLVEDYRTDDGSKSRPVFVTDYPYEVSPLSRRKDPERQAEQYGADFPVPLVDRFELFVEGRELANAFSELNDPDDQAERFRAQLVNREKGDDEAMDFDADYIRALSYGMPPTAGFGLGIDRLVMLLCGQKSIRDVVLFPLLRPEG